jgi:hypothetical protein
VTQTFTVPAGVSLIHVELWGAGGGGASGSAFGGGGGGGGGGYFRAVVRVVDGESFAVLTGSQGAGGVYNGTCGFGSGQSGRQGGPTIMQSYYGGLIAAHGGAGGAADGVGGGGGWWTNDLSTVANSLGRPGHWGGNGGALGVYPGGGRTPNGSVDKPYGDTGGHGGYSYSCQPGQPGNHGYAVISW